MDKKMVAAELLKVAKDLMADDKYNNPIDQWLDDNGWKETHGIGLYTNHRFPLVGVDTNSGEAAVNVYESESDIFNGEGSLMDYTENINEIDKAVKNGSVVGQLFGALRKKYYTYEGLLTSGSIAFFGKKDDEVSFSVYWGNWTVAVGGGVKFGFRAIQRKISPNVSSIVRFIEDAQQEILAGGGSNR